MMKHLVLLTMIAVFGVSTLAAAADPAKPGAACKDDRRKFCKDVKKTGGKPRDCLMQHKDELSDACKAFLDKPKKGKGKKAKDGAAAPAEGAKAAAPTEGAAPAAPAEGAAPASPTESAPQAEPEVPGEQK